MLDGFSPAEIETDEARIFLRSAGSGPAILLLHGFPQTHIMWRSVAPLLTHDHTVICADLRGYGRSSCPASAPDHTPYAKRAMARDMILVMEQLGFRRFSVAGHDRGGRVAYRMALDYPDRMDRLAVLDILPIDVAWDRADARFALGFWPWSLLAQPEPLPERILSSVPDAIVDNALREWGSRGDVFPPEIRDVYTDVLRDPEHAHAICEEYRAAATADPMHDRADRENGRRISCPLLVLWSAEGPLDTWYAGEGGPLELWRLWSDDVRGHAVTGGHFFPEENPLQTGQALSDFFGAP